MANNEGKSRKTDRMASPIDNDMAVYNDRFKHLQGNDIEV